MKWTVALLALSITGQSFASFNRLWVGHKRKDVTTETYLNGLNKSFFKATIDLGKEKGLLAYQPYITSMKSDVPDELALVIYESEEKYKAMRSTPEGERYSAQHWDYFDKSNSKSTVSEPFKGELVEGKAYELNPANTDWQAGNTTVVIYENKSDTDLVKLAQDFEKLKNNGQVRNSILLITNEWIIEYRSMKKGTSNFIKLPLKVKEVTALPNSTLEALKTSVGFSEGVNFSF